MSDYIKIGITDYDEIEQILDDISKSQKNININENLCVFLESLTSEQIQSFFSNGLKENIDVINKYYLDSAKIINPDAVKKMKVLKKSLFGALEFFNDTNISVKESIENNIGWNYTIQIKCPYIGFTNNILSLYKIALLACDAFETACSDSKNEFVMYFTVNNIYLAI